MRYVERDAEGKIVGHYACKQPRYAEEQVPDDHPDLIAFREARRAKRTRRSKSGDVPNGI